MVAGYKTLVAWSVVCGLSAKEFWWFGLQKNFVLEQRFIVQLDLGAGMRSATFSLEIVDHDIQIMVYNDLGC